MNTKTKKLKPKLLKITLVSLMMILLVPCFARANNTLRIHPTNSRYFTDESGKAIYLTGSHTWFNIHYTDVNPQMSYSDFENYLNWMQSHGHNFTRLWIGWANKYPDPWARTGPGDALDGRGLKFDMTKFDQNYFNLIKQRIQQVENHGMYCSIMFFGSLMGMTTDGWSKMAWHPGNNINQALANAFDVSNGYSFFTTSIAALNIQRAFVCKIVDTLNDFDHIIWEIGNEAQIQESINWQNKMAVYVRSYETSKHLIGITSDGNDSTSYLIDGPGDWISPDRFEGDYSNGGPANYNAKIVISDTDHLWGWSKPEDAEIMRKWVWKTFTRGNHPIFMEPYNAINPAQGYNGTIDPVFDPVRGAMGHTLTYANKINDLSLMIPSENSSYCSTKYCLRNPGNEYLLYQPNSGIFTVNIQSGTYNYEWFNPKTGKTVKTGSITGEGDNKSFTPPFSGDAVLYLWRSGVVTGNIIDNGDSGTSFAGSWSVSSAPDPYGSDSLYSKDDGSTYTFTNNITGSHEISLWWTEWPSRSDNVAVEIRNGNTLLETVHINQQNNGGQWNKLGTYDFNGAAKVTIISSGNDTSTCADAAKFEPAVSDTTPPTRSNSQPTGTLSSGTTSTNISLTTNETAACKYGTLASVPYDEMPNTFTNTNSTNHSTLVTGLEDGNTYAYYARCRDTADNVNTDDFVITFAVGEALMPCDLNKDSEVNIQDVVLCVNVILGIEQNEVIIGRADVNEDGSVNTLDVMMVVNEI